MRSRCQVTTATDCGRTAHKRQCATGPRRCAVNTRGRNTGRTYGAPTKWRDWCRTLPSINHPPLRNSDDSAARVSSIGARRQPSDRFEDASRCSRTAVACCCMCAGCTGKSPSARWRCLDAFVTFNAAFRPALVPSAVSPCVHAFPTRTHCGRPLHRAFFRVFQM